MRYEVNAVMRTVGVGKRCRWRTLLVVCLRVRASWVLLLRFFSFGLFDVACVFGAACRAAVRARALRAPSQGFGIACTHSLPPLVRVVWVWPWWSCAGVVGGSAFGLARCAAGR